MKHKKNKEIIKSIRMDSSFWRLINNADVPEKTFSKRVRALILSGLGHGVIDTAPVLEKLNRLNQNLYPIGSNLNQLAYHFNSMEEQGGKVLINGVDFTEYLNPILEEVKNTTAELKLIRNELYKMKKEI